MSDETLRFAWWNTSLSPRIDPRRKAKPLTEPRFNRAAKLLKRLTLRMGADIVVLGEVSPEIARRLLDALPSGLGFRVESESLAEPKKRIGVALLHNDRVRVSESALLRYRYFGSDARLALRFNLTLSADNTPLDLFAVHWPSNRDAASPKRRKSLGAGLALHVQNAAACTLVLGDFNDEPFHDSLDSQMQASRDRAIVMERKALLYNASWRLLGHRRAHIAHASAPSPAGTYYFRSPETSWRTYDQVFVSPALLTGTWQLHELDVRVWRSPLLLNRSGRPRLEFDHLPVLGSLRRPAIVAPQETQQDG
jgi:endonuclease/exonuclease/phosphatase family metal-dependent hydrolase